MNDFDGKIAFVTGAGSGIGRAAAHCLAQRGAKVAAVGANPESLHATVEQIRQDGGAALVIVADVRDERAVQAAVAETLNRFGAVQVALHCAGVPADAGLLEEASVSTYERIFEVHVKGTFLCLKYVLPAIVRAGGGAVVNTTSTGGLVGFPGGPIYCAAKHAIVGLTKVAALDYAARNVRVNSIAPSAVETPMLDRFVQGRPEVLTQLAAAHPVGRLASAVEIAEGMLWLASDSARYVTGHTLVMDGGYTAR